MRLRGILNLNYHCIQSLTLINVRGGHLGSAFGCSDDYAVMVKGVCTRVNFTGSWYVIGSCNQQCLWRGQKIKTFWRPKPNFWRQALDEIGSEEGQNGQDWQIGVLFTMETWQYRRKLISHDFEASYWGLSEIFRYVAATSLTIFIQYFEGHPISSNFQVGHCDSYRILNSSNSYKIFKIFQK